MANIQPRKFIRSILPLPIAIAGLLKRKPVEPHEDDRAFDDLLHRLDRRH